MLLHALLLNLLPLRRPVLALLHRPFRLFLHQRYVPLPYFPFFFSPQFPSVFLARGVGILLLIVFGLSEAVIVSWRMGAVTMGAVI